MECSYGKCKAQAKWRYSPDIDVSGLKACDDHKDTVQNAYIVLMTSGDNDIFYSLLGTKKPKD